MLITFGKVQRVAVTKIKRLASGKVQRTAVWIFSCFMAVLLVENHLHPPVMVEYVNCSTTRNRSLPSTEEPTTTDDEWTTEPPLTTPPPLVLPNNVTISLDLAGHVADFEESVLSNLTNYPWDDDPLCRHFAVKFGKKDSLPIFPLTSFPGSGVSWFRQMIEGLTGIYTSSTYFNEKPIIHKDHYGRYIDGRCRCTILQKNHEAAVAVSMDHYLQLINDKGFNSTVHNNNHRGLVLLRNPIDAAIAYRNFISGGVTEMANDSYFRGERWDSHTEYVAFAWADHATRWIDNIVNGTVVFYENLVHRTEAELRRIVPYFYSEPIDPDRMACVIKHKHRSDRKRLNRTKITLTATQRRRFDDAIAKVQASLRRRNWPTLPLELYNFHESSH